MKILGIDYGESKIGLAVSESSLAYPLRVLRIKEGDDPIKKIKDIAEEEGIDKIVVGISEGVTGEKSKEFAEKLGAETFDETLTTQSAQELSREAGIKRKKRKDMEDAYAASIILQNYLDMGKK